MPKRIYNGAHPEVELGLPDGSVQTVKHGEAVDVPDDVAKNLDEQEDNWLAVVASVGTPKAKTEESA